MKSRLEIRATRQPFIHDTIEIRMAEISGKKVSIVQPLTLETIDLNETCRELPPAFSLSPEDAQQFMDELWRTGIRPTEGAGSVGQLAAVSRHLEDMRTLVFKTNA